METLKSILETIQKGDFLASLDLSEAYLHIPIRPNHRRFLRFVYAGAHYQYRPLPFGLKSLPKGLYQNTDHSSSTPALTGRGSVSVFGRRANSCSFQTRRGAHHSHDSNLFTSPWFRDQLGEELIGTLVIHSTPRSANRHPSGSGSNIYREVSKDRTSPSFDTTTGNDGALRPSESTGRDGLMSRDSVMVAFSRP